MDILETFESMVAGHLQGISYALLELEKTYPFSDRERLFEKLFRECHNLKGSADVLCFGEIVNLAHDLESILGLMRKGQVIEKSNLYELLNQGLDTIALAVRSRLTGKQLDGTVLESARQRLERVAKESMPGEEHVR